ncbi:IS481 family transposase [Aeromicrobium sp. Marseille-Q0843]|uniref:IS481 family transposase n=1 Tax=Aeromicrobium phoceense TaxID=2754045 RepID=A0A838XR99_9ACTN|nr:IS481 family transposase [Aeromicrobium phoceense]MBA4609554.1 IS481 family transposase [Aeromicrobium phoceense]
MSKARLVITAVVLEGRKQAEVARSYGVSQSWVSKLVARYRAEGEAAFEPRSRRPKTSPTAIGAHTVDLILRLRKELSGRGLDAGPDTIAWHLTQHHQITVSPATISRRLAKAGLVTPEPKKRPRSSYVRFQSSMPNETWQSDFTHYRLIDGQDVEILTWLDDCTRYAVRVTAHARVTTPIVLAEFRHAYETAGIPASTLTDNGMVFTVRLAGIGRQGGRNAFENELRRLHITQKNGRPNRPTTQGKVERFQQTMKKWLRAQPDQPVTIGDLQTLLNTFVDHYNHRRPHRSLPHQATPATVFTTMPKALPNGTRDHETHHRIRHDRVDQSGAVTLRIAGKLHHIGIGRTHTRTHVILLIDDLHIRIINATTGELLRDLIIDPDRDYQPQK